MNKNFLEDKLFWIREPQKFIIDDKKIEIYTEPNTDLWQRTYYGFRNDNSPILQTKTKDKYFSFTVKTIFESKRRFDQCGVTIYIDSDNWFKASIEYENENYQRLGSVVYFIYLKLMMKFLSEYMHAVLKTLPLKLYLLICI